MNEPMTPEEKLEEIRKCFDRWNYGDIDDIKFADRMQEILDAPSAEPEPETIFDHSFRLFEESKKFKGVADCPKCVEMRKHLDWAIYQWLLAFAEWADKEASSGEKNSSLEITASRKAYIERFIKEQSPELICNIEKQLAPAEPKGEVVTVYLHTLEHYNQCDNSITTVEMEYDDTPETFKQIHRFCPEEGELIKACMTLTQIREGDDE